MNNFLNVIAKFFFIFVVISFPCTLHAQTFLKAYKQYQVRLIDSIIVSYLDTRSFANNKDLKEFKEKKLLAVKNHLTELDTIFNSYKAKNDFDFNKADSIFMIYQTLTTTPISDVLIWSGKDTISYGHVIECLNGYRINKKVVYKPFRYVRIKHEGYHEINDRDTLMALTSNRNFITARKFEKMPEEKGGVITTLIAIYKVNGHYQFEQCLIPPFQFETVYRKK